MGRAATETEQLPHLCTFSQAAEAASFTAAAKALGLTQAAVSQRIHALEKAVGKSLFQRRGGRVLLTEAGRKLYEYAQRILELQRQARRDLSGQESPVTGELTLAASSIPGEHLLPALLSAFRRKHPGIQVRVAVSDSMSVMSQVEHGEVSLGLVGRRADKPHLDFRVFAKDRMVLVVPSRHPLGRKKTASVADLCRYPLIVREPGSGLRDWFEKALERVGRSSADLKVALELGSNEAIKEAVLRGIGAAVLSASAARQEIKAKRLRALDLTELDSERDLFIVTDRRRVLPLPARQFLLFLEHHSGSPR